MGALFGGAQKKKAYKHKVKAFKLRRQIEKWQSFQRLRASLAAGIQQQADFLSQQAVSGAGLGSSATQGQMSAYATQMRLGVKEYQGQQQLMDQRAQSLVASGQADMRAGFINQATGLATDVMTLNANLEDNVWKD